MAGYDPRRLDGDPTYAPGRVRDKATYWWRPTKTDIAAGYSIKAYRLTGTDEEQAAKCRELTRELLQWRAGAPKMTPGTWGWIIARYKSDEFSPFQEVKDNTRKSYIDECSYWEEAIGQTYIAETSFERMKGWKKAMEVNYVRKKHEAYEAAVAFWEIQKRLEEDKFRTTLPPTRAPSSRIPVLGNVDPTAFIHRKFTHLRMIANYGLAVQPGLFRDVCAILGSGQMKIRAPKPRTMAPTEAQVLSVIAAADAAGDAAMALGMSLQWWLTLRAVDVRGQWLGDSKSRRWADGLTWNMVDLKAGIIAKAQSKTERHDGALTTWDLTPLPDLLHRLASIPENERVGPVIKRNGKPFEKRHYASLFRKYARAAGVPDAVLMMDIRAGAVNDGLIHGADRTQLQHAAGHKDGKTTERYIRVRDVGANKVIQMRSGK